MSHKRREWARDDDGDGVREVHSNRIEGFWLGLRNYLRPFRGVSKWSLDVYLAFYQGNAQLPARRSWLPQTTPSAHHPGGNMSRSSYPQRVRMRDGSLLDRVRSVRPGIGKVCAVRDDDTLWCWGAADNGVLGRGLTRWSATRRRVLGL